MARMEKGTAMKWRYIFLAVIGLGHLLQKYTF
jgi:hypothetical protein